MAPVNNEYIYKSPNDIYNNGITYIEELSQYNRQDKNPLHLLPAYRLYDNEVYRDLVNKYGLENIFILSAGWGLISADFLTPNYNITFSTSRNIKPEFRRKKSAIYNDLCHLSIDSTDDLIFIGGKDYQPLFDKLVGCWAFICRFWVLFRIEPALPSLRFVQEECEQPHRRAISQ